ncbi:SPOSA6832_03889, partial [Sporobolomyces salmonicolor]
MEDAANKPLPSGAEGRDQFSVLQHLKRNQVISPQHLAPQHLLTPYLPRPNFSLAYPLGPPTSYGPTHDPFVRYGLDPLEASPLNPFWKAEFTTTMGKIKSRGKTGLQRKSQRRVGKAIRRARSMGIIPTFGVSVPGRGGERY